MFIAFYLKNFQLQQIATQSAQKADNALYLLIHRIQKWDPIEKSEDFKNDFVSHALKVNKGKKISNEQLDIQVFRLKQKANYVSWVHFTQTKKGSYECKSSTMKTILVSIDEVEDDSFDYIKTSIEGLYQNKNSNTFIWMNNFEDDLFRKENPTFNRIVNKPMRKI